MNVLPLRKPFETFSHIWMDLSRSLHFTDIQE
jgi:hypothetical protein